ncbi:Transposon Tf2-6 polyprotein [Linum perenne]
MNRFIPKSAERQAPFFAILKAAAKFSWTEECSRAFEELKAFLTTPPTLAAPIPGDELYLYVAIAATAVSSILVKRVDKEERPVFYTSKSLVDAETRYSPLEKSAYAVIIASRKLRPYFHAHTIHVVTNLPLKAALRSMGVAGRMSKWAVELSEYDVHFQPRTAIKAQALADFVVEGCVRAEGRPDDYWELYVDGASSKNGAGAGVVLKSPQGVLHETALRFSKPRTNNAAEYGALIAGLRMAKTMGVSHLKVFSDSAIVVNELSGVYEVREETLAPYNDQAKIALKVFETTEIHQVAREDNTHADALSKLATALSFEEDRMITVEKEREEGECMAIDTQTDATPPTAQAGVTPPTAPLTDWRAPIRTFIETDALPADRALATKIRRRAARCVLLDGEMYRKSSAGPYLRCLNDEEASFTLREIHQGVCGMHIGAKSLEKNVLLQGYYWPTIRRDSEELVKRCHKCQLFANTHHLPSTALQPIVSPWPFAFWGMDLLGPFPEAVGKRKYIIVAVDYFTKWVEAEALASITAYQVQKFVLKNIITRFSLPLGFVCDHGTQFDCTAFLDFCEEFKIMVRLASVAYPQANGQAEAINKLILQGLKKRVDEAKGKWVDELPNILWAHRTSYKTATDETPYTLVYGTEAVLPVEVNLPSLRIQHFDQGGNDAGLHHNLDIIEERREDAAIRLVAEKEQLARRYNAHLRPHHLEEGDWVVRKVFRPIPQQGKLNANWEGPYKVREVIGPSTFKLERPTGEPIHKTWNAMHLRKYSANEEEV